MNTALNLYAGWTGFLAGAVSGALLGLRFHQEQWLGGYGSFPRRMLRLGHIACFGMGLLNVLFALSALALPLGEPWAGTASIAWIAALAGMPVCCWLAAWRKSTRHLFPLPVIATLVALGAMFIGWRAA